MSELFRWYLGGQMATAAEFALLVAPTVNSYRRFLPGSWAPTGIGWAVDNRTLGFRIVGHGQAMRVENRIPGRRRQLVPRLRRHDRRRAVRHREPHRSARARTTATATRLPTLPRIPSTFAEAIELWREQRDRPRVLRR